ncbi:MAG: methyltransferase, TIGR04325 family [Spirochaetes bacterium]|nr:methyltransferase, TIGR04325 family [Spirochaetota bacterium]
MTRNKYFEIKRIKKFIKLFTPPIVLKGYRFLRYGRQHLFAKGIYLAGDYLSWENALAASTGYDSEIILEKTKAALLKVKNGEAVYERDSVLFDKIQYAWPLLAGLMWVAARCGGRLNVLDFGGSLGSSYFQNRRFLQHLLSVRWNIVEQVQHVEIGRRYFEDDHLKFYVSIEECLNQTAPQVILLSSVLQYVPEPYTLLDKISNLTFDHLIIDRTSFWNGASDRICVQYVPSKIYEASYPSWIFSDEKFHQRLIKHWEIVAEFDNSDRLSAPMRVTYRGLIAIRKMAR